MVHPVTVMVFNLNSEGEYDKPDIYGEDEKVKIGIFKELVIDLEEIFVV